MMMSRRFPEGRSQCSTRRTFCGKIRLARNRNCHLQRRLGLVWCGRRGRVTSAFPLPGSVATVSVQLVMRFDWPMTNTRTDVWASRVGDSAATQLRSRERQQVAGIGFLLGILVGVGVGSLLFVFSAPRDPSIGLLGAIGIATMLSGCVGVAMFINAASTRSVAVTNAFLTLRRGYVGVTAMGVSDAMHSVTGFDTWRLGLEARVSGDDGAASIRAWSPDIRRSILPGRTARTWRLRASVLALLGLGTMTGMAALGGFGNMPSPELWISGWAVAALLIAAGAVLSAVASLKARAEFRSGYVTSLANRPPFDVQLALDLVDGKTGYLLRHAGAARLTPAIFRERLSQIRSTHPGERPARIGE